MNCIEKCEQMVDNVEIRVAILYICTGKYVVFWKDFFDSCEEFFLQKSKKEYYVFTDSEELYEEERANVHKIYQENLGWPDNTLLRYHIFSGVINELRKFDYIFFMNANVICNQVITEEEFLPVDEGILVVQHPGFYASKREEYTYDTNPKSSAFISEDEGSYYVCGGVNGGKSDKFINLIIELKSRIDRDYKKGVIALWHDESHINRYIIEYPIYKILSPAYCYPEGWDLPFEKKIIVRDKSKYFDVDDTKGYKKNNKKNICLKFIFKLKSYIMRVWQ